MSQFELGAVQCDEHILGGLPPYLDERRILGRLIPSLQRGHIGELDDDHPLRLPDRVVLFEDVMAAGLGEVTTAMLRNPRANLHPAIR